MLYAWLSHSLSLWEYSTLSIVPSESACPQIQQHPLVLILACCCPLASLPHTPFLLPPELPISPDGSSSGHSSILRDALLPNPSPSSRHRFSTPPLAYSFVVPSPVTHPRLPSHGGPRLHCLSFTYCVQDHCAQRQTLGSTLSILSDFTTACRARAGVPALVRHICSLPDLHPG